MPRKSSKENSEEENERFDLDDILDETSKPNMKLPKDEKEREEKCSTLLDNFGEQGDDLTDDLILQGIGKLKCVEGAEKLLESAESKETLPTKKSRNK